MPSTHKPLLQEVLVIDGFFLRISQFAELDLVFGHVLAEVVVELLPVCVAAGAHLAEDRGLAHEDGRFGHVLAGVDVQELGTKNRHCLNELGGRSYQTGWQAEWSTCQ